MLILKNILKKIRKSVGRFLSLTFIVALGAAFFAGVRETSSDMIKTLDEKYDNDNLMDYRIVSTVGFTEDEINTLKNIDLVETIEATYTYEVLIKGEATKIYGLTDNLNKVTLVKGRMPLNNQEILVQDGTYELNEIIEIQDNEFLKENTFTVVGTVTSSMYIYENLGVSSIDDGKLDTFMYVLKDAFNLDYYTEVYLTARGSRDTTSYTEEYQNVTNSLYQKLEELKPILETKRYEEIKKDAYKLIYEKEDLINKEKVNNKSKLDKYYDELNKNTNKLNKGKKDIDNGFKELDSKNKEILDKLNNSRFDLNQQLEGLELMLLNGYNIRLDELEGYINTIEDATIKESLKQIKDNYNKIIDGLDNINAEEIKWQNTYNTNISKLKENEQKLLKEEETLNQAWQDYYQKISEYENNINKAYLEIEQAKKNIEQLPKPEWYLFDRNDNTGYQTFYEASIKVDAIAGVFPLFFILVAFLMCLNTMVRMIEEERSEIGLFVSLGISKFQIVTSYVFYVLMATCLGLSVGLTIGYSVVPRVLYGVYTVSYVIPPLHTYANPLACILIIGVSIITMSIIAVYTVIKMFKQEPAILLRPKAPKNGTKVFLEKIKFFWKRLSFVWKVCFRNLFRYKKRIIMALIGISGCTALLLTGFGIKDSISGILDKQYNEIIKYDTMLILNDEVTEENQDINALLNNLNINNPMYAHSINVSFKVNNKNIDVYSFAFLENDINEYITLNDLNNNKMVLDDNGVIITERMAELLNIKIGDTFNIYDNNNMLYVLKVSGITKNYVNNYIYMNKNYYEKIFKDITYNTILINANNKDIGSKLMDSNYFGAITYMNDNLKILEDIIKGMNNIVLLIIGFSTFLAITVLYNLTTINISERLREIATLKVLGFKDGEVSMYVYRETLLLTIMGTLIGLGLGVLLNMFVLNIAQTDDILFIKHIDLSSYIYTLIIMVVFTLVVQVITHFLLKKVNMVDSLKSIE